MGWRSANVELWDAETLKSATLRRGGEIKKGKGRDFVPPPLHFGESWRVGELETAAGKKDKPDDG